MMIESRDFMISLSGLFYGVVGFWEFWKNLLVHPGLEENTYYAVGALEKKGFWIHTWVQWENLCFWTISFWLFVQLSFCENLMVIGMVVWNLWFVYELPYELPHDQLIPKRKPGEF
jgi:hypothetical protein